MHAPPPRASRCLSHVADATEGARLNCEGAWFAQAAQLVWVMLSLRLRRWPVAYLSGRDLAWLERRRAELFGLMAQVGDFRRGALNAVWRKCGKPNCACAQPGHRGHGPQRNLTRRIGGKTVNVHLKPGPELEKAQREVAGHQRFADLVEEVSEVSEAICAARPATAGAAPPPAGGERGGSRRGSRRSPPRR